MSQEPLRKESKKVLVALGANAQSAFGDAQSTVQEALRLLAQTREGFASSKLYRTPAFPAGSGPDFVNAACVVRASEEAGDILHQLHEIESRFGRTREVRWGQRTLDLDLLAVGAQVAPDTATFEHWRTLPLADQQASAPDQLILPHPRVQDRPFVLVPLADVAPDWVHPVLGKTTLEMLAAHSDAARAEITPL